MSNERRREERFETPAIIGLLRNLTQHTHPQLATMRNLSKDGFLIETWQNLELHDAIEFRVDSHTFLGEVVHCRREGHKRVAGVRIEHRLDDEQLRRILEPY
jgi:hypothetical protein